MGRKADAKAMPLQLQFELQLARHDVVPEVRAWVDVTLSGQLQCEFELPLRRSSPSTWRGEFAAIEARPMLYRLAIRAHAGATWLLRIDDRVLGRCLLTDADELGIDKCHIVGTLVLPAVAPASRRWTNALVIARPLLP